MLESCAVFAGSDASEGEGLKTQDFCRQLLAIARKKLTGTLIVENRSGQAKSFLCHDGTIADVDPGGEVSFLSRVLRDCGAVPPRALKKAQKTVEKTGVSLGAAILELDQVPEEEIIKAIEEGIASEVTEAIGWSLDQSMFRSHAVGETIEGFSSELSHFFDLLADPVTLFLEAARRLERWDLVKECYDLLLDVFYATPGTFGYFREPETFPAEIRILGAVDGVKDIEEVIAASGLDPFTAVEVTRGLIREGTIELINPVQLFQLGTQYIASGNLDKASRLLRRAMDRGLNDFDVELRLAQCLEALGRKKEAAASYFQFSNKCLSQLRVDDALRSLRHVIKLSPEQKEAMVKLVELLIEHNRLDEAYETSMQFAQRLDSKGDAETALDLLLRLRDSHLQEVKLHERIIELAEKCHAYDIVRQAKETVALKFHGRRDAADALESYQRLFCEGNDSLEVRLKLIELHKEHGNRQKAIDHINAILHRGGRRQVKDAETLVYLHETLRKLRPADARANRFLVDHHLQKDDKAKAIEILQSWVPELEKAGDFEDLTAALTQLIALDDRAEHRWQLAVVLHKLGRDAASRAQLLELARHALRRRDFEQAARALEHVLKLNPLDIETRSAQVELYDQSGDKKRAAEKLKDLATLEVIGGRIQEAEEYCRQYLVVHPEDAEVVDKFGKLCQELGDTQKATEQFLKAAKIHIESRNFGLAQRALERLLKLHPQHAEGRPLLERVQSMIARADAPPPAAADTPPSVVVVAAPRKEPPAGPAAVKTSVAGITARLRNLRTDGGEAAPAAKPLPAVAGLAAKLKGLRSGATDAGASTAAPAAAESASQRPDDKTSRTPADPRRDAAPATEGAAAAGEAGSANASRVLRSAAERLKALAGKKRAEVASGAPGAPSDSPDSASASAAAEPAAAGIAVAGEDAEASAAPGSAPAAARVRKPLGGSASKLAALRKAKD